MTNETRYRCRLTDEFGPTDDCVVEDTATTEKQAAERYCEKRNWDTCEFPPERTVLVRSGNTWLPFEVTLESVPMYTAKLKKGVRS